MTARQAASAHSTCLLTIGAPLIVSLVATVAPAEQPAVYSGLDASHDAYMRNEERRRSEVSPQLDLVERLNWYASAAPYYSGDVYYGSRSLTESSHAHGRWHRRRWSAFKHGPIAEHGRAVERDLWGRSPLVGGVRQPVGQRQIQTGPNRWESHPIYAEPPAPPAAPAPPNRPRAF